MASIKKHSSGRYQARWRLTPNGKQFSKLFDRKIDAERHVAAIVTDLERGSYVDPKAGRETVSSYAARWAASQVWRPSTRSRMHHILDRYILPAFGDRPISSVRRSDVQAWVAGLAAGSGAAPDGGLAPSTVENYTNVFAMLFNSAVLDEVIVKTPMRRLNLPRPESNCSTLVPLTTGQVHALSSEFPLRYGSVVLAQAGLGLRQAELTGLTLDRIDWTRRTVRIDRQLLRTKGGVPEWGPTKTAASNRLLPLAESVGFILAAHLERNPVGEYGLVFTNSEGRPLRTGTYSHRFRAATKRLGIEATSHDLRHYCASMLIASGSSVKAVQRYLGHATAGETLDTYGHLWPDDDDRIRAAIDVALGNSGEPLRNGDRSTTGSG